MKHRKVNSAQDADRWVDKKSKDVCADCEWMSMHRAIGDRPLKGPGAGLKERDRLRGLGWYLTISGGSPPVFVKPCEACKPKILAADESCRE